MTYQSVYYLCATYNDQTIDLPFVDEDVMLEAKANLRRSGYVVEVLPPYRVFSSAPDALRTADLATNHPESRV